MTDQLERSVRRVFDEVVKHAPVPQEQPLDVDADQHQVRGGRRGLAVAGAAAAVMVGIGAIALSQQSPTEEPDGTRHVVERAIGSELLIPGRLPDDLRLRAADSSSHGGLPGSSMVFANVTDEARMTDVVLARVIEPQEAFRPEDHESHVIEVDGQDVELRYSAEHQQTWVWIPLRGRTVELVTINQTLTPQLQERLATIAEAIAVSSDGTLMVAGRLPRGMEVIATLDLSDVSPFRRLEFRGDDGRSLWLELYLDSPPQFDRFVIPENTRRVDIRGVAGYMADYSDGNAHLAAWTERAGLTVMVGSFGLTTQEFSSTIEHLTPATVDEWHDYGSGAPQQNHTPTTQTTE